MVNKPKNKGTAAETALVTYLQISGFPYAERRSLQGSLDKGDVTGTPGICWECKVANHFSLSGWLRETEVERVNSGSDWGVLVCKPAGLGARSVDRWPAIMRQGDFDRLREAARAVTGAWSISMVTQVAKVALITPFLTSHPSAAAIYAPPGYRDRQSDWYVAVRLSVMVDLLRKSGYGDPMPPDSLSVS